jgi:hypothetical protein
MFVTNPLTNYPIRIGGRTFTTLIRQIQTGQTFTHGFNTHEKKRSGGSGKAQTQRKRRNKEKNGFF